MTKKIIIICLGILAVGGVVAGIMISRKNETSSAETNTAAVSYTLTEISQHATAEDCWMTINDKVYDVTGFVPQHPGEDLILAGCGQDATTMFTQRPDGTSHSATAAALLETYYIGELNR